MDYYVKSYSIRDNVENKNVYKEKYFSSFEFLNGTYTTVLYLGIFQLYFPLLNCMPSLHFTFDNGMYVLIVSQLLQFKRIRCELFSLRLLTDCHCSTSYHWFLKSYTLIALIIQIFKKHFKLSGIAGQSVRSSAVSLRCLERHGFKPCFYPLIFARKHHIVF